MSKLFIPILLLVSSCSSNDACFFTPATEWKKAKLIPEFIMKQSPNYNTWYVNQTGDYLGCDAGLLSNQCGSYHIVYTEDELGKYNVIREVVCTS